MSTGKSISDAPPRNRRLEQGAQSRTRLVEAARALFEQHGYASTSTEALLAATGLTRGALYHHFRDKKDLFLAVCEAVHADLSGAIEAAADPHAPPLDQLLAGAMAWIDAIAQPGPRQVLLIDGPSVLGDLAWAELDGRHGYQQLRAVVAELLGSQGRFSALQVDACATALNGSINELARWLARQPAPMQSDARNAAAAALAAYGAGLVNYY